MNFLGIAWESKIQKEICLPFKSYGKFLLLEKVQSSSPECI